MPWWMIKKLEEKRKEAEKDRSQPRLEAPRPTPFEYDQTPTEDTSERGSVDIDFSL